MYSEIKKNLEESNRGYSRLYNHIQNSDDNFAIIGSNDKDNPTVSHFPELQRLVDKLCISSRTTDPNKKQGRNIGYNHVKGRYTYSEGPNAGTRDTEKSIIVYGLTKEEALDIARKINQESIVWKDNDFFGILRCSDGEPDMEFSKGMNFSKAEEYGFGTQMKKDQHSDVGVVFEGEVAFINTKTKKAEWEPFRFEKLQK